jgi:hypothetical protein
MASVFLIVSPHAYSADFAPPPRFPLKVAPTPTIKSTPASSIMLGSITVDFDKTTLYEAMKQIKAGKIQHEGDAGESAYWLCYSIRTPEGWEQLWLLSHGEMGGDEHVIHGVVANIPSSSPSLTSCPELTNNLRHVKLNNGLWLGAKSEEIKKKLGSRLFNKTNGFITNPGGSYVAIKEQRILVLTGFMSEEAFRYLKQVEKL